MRLTSNLYAQHLGWTFKKHWHIQKRRTIIDTGAEAELKKHGIFLTDVKEVLKENKKVFERFQFPPVAVNPDLHDEICNRFDNTNVLLEGMPQAQILTKTIEINGFPKNIEEAIQKLNFSNNVHKNVQNLIMSSHVFDAEQIKLPKVKLVDKPAINLPRVYGISRERRARLLINKLLFECEKLATPSAKSRKRIVENAVFNVLLKRDDKLLQYDLTGETFIAATKPLEPVKGKYEGEIPDIFPILPTISIPETNIYKLNDFYAINKSFACSHPHTIFSHFDTEKVKNLHEIAVTPSQFLSRTMIKAFTVAASRARQLYGSSIQELPKPIVVQSIQTDGCTFHLGVFQLNTLKLNENEGIKNYWFHEAKMDLFSECGYKEGRPILSGYNQDVFRCINAFYNNV